MGCGGNIRAARKRAGLTQAQLAKKCGLATITIGQYERDSREPRQEQLQIIADALGIHVLELLGLPAKQEYTVSGTLRFSVDLMAANISQKYEIPEEMARCIVNDCYQTFKRDGEYLVETSSMIDIFDRLSTADQKTVLSDLHAIFLEKNFPGGSSGEH